MGGCAVAQGRARRTTQLASPCPDVAQLGAATRPGLGARNRNDLPLEENRVAMPRLTADQLAALREVLGEGERRPAEIESLVAELQRQHEHAAPVGHGLAEARSLAIHRLVAGRLRQEPRIVDVALRRVETWAAEGKMHPAYADAWRELLEGPLDALLAVLSDRGEAAAALRQCTPFVGVIDQRTRLRIWREERERVAS